MIHYNYNTICGIDEAGRGPVLGPLVMAGVLVQDEKEQNILKEMGCKDSKLLTKKKREHLFDQIQSSYTYEINVISAKEIDEALLSPQNNLNKLEAYHTALLINALKAKKAIIDLPQKNKETYAQYIVNDLHEKSTKLVLEHKADENYAVVSAASILAKVTRDRIIDEYKEKVGIDFGSGYMTDEKTVDFLQKNWNNKNINFFRKEWASWKNIKKEKEQQSLFDF